MVETLQSRSPIDNIVIYKDGILKSFKIVDCNAPVYNLLVSSNICLDLQ